jgi:hypothetical protein
MTSKSVALDGRSMHIAVACIHAAVVGFTVLLFSDREQLDGHGRLELACIGTAHSDDMIDANAIIADDDISSRLGMLKLLIERGAQALLYVVGNMIEAG